MSLSRRLLLLLPAVTCCLAPVQVCLAQKSAKVNPFVVQTENYVAFDISNTSTNGSVVNQIALDDASDAAFSFWNGPVHKVGLWQSGALVTGSPKETGSEIALTVYNFSSQLYNAGTLSSSDGTAFDRLTGGSSPLQPNPVGAGFAINTKGDLVLRRADFAACLS